MLDEALVLRFNSPASSTGENVVEFQCHGGRAVVDAVLARAGGNRRLAAAEPGEFTRRAFENGRIDLTEAEGLADLIEAETESQRKAALALAEGGLSKQIARLAGAAAGLSAPAERAIDYDEDGCGNRSSAAARLRGARRRTGQWLDRPRIEPLKDGVRVVVAGPPNAGKSSLINAIAGEERAIVTDLPGTTRDHIEVPLALGGVPMLLTDTAGLRETDDPVEAIGVARAERWSRRRTCCVWLGDPGEAPDHPRLVQVHPKADLAERGMRPRIACGLGDHRRRACRAAGARSRRWRDRCCPAEDAIALNRRQATHLDEAADALAPRLERPTVVLIAEESAPRPRRVRPPDRASRGRGCARCVVRALLPRQVSVPRETLIG